MNDGVLYQEFHSTHMWLIKRMDYVALVVDRSCEYSFLATSRRPKIVQGPYMYRSFAIRRTSNQLRSGGQQGLTLSSGCIRLKGAVIMQSVRPRSFRPPRNQTLYGSNRSELIPPISWPTQLPKSWSATLLADRGKRVNPK